MGTRRQALAGVSVLILALGVFLAWFGTRPGPDSTPDRSGELRTGPSVEAAIENSPTGVGSFTVRGKVPALPDNVRLEISLWAHASDGSQIKATSFLVLLKGEQFYAKRDFKNKLFAPLLYEVQVNMTLGGQRRAIGQELVQKKLVAPGAELEIIRHTFEQGTSEEQATFERKLLEGFRTSVLKAQQLHTRFVEALRQGNQQRESHATQELKELAQEFRALQRRYVVLPEEQLTDEFWSALQEMVDHLKRRQLGHSRTVWSRLERILDRLDARE